MKPLLLLAMLLACTAHLGSSARAEDRPAGEARTVVTSFGPSPVPVESLGPGVLACAPQQDHVSIVVDRPGASTVWIDGKAGEAFEAIGSLEEKTYPRCIWSSSGRHAYVGQRAGKWILVLDGKSAGAFDEARLGSFAFHAKGQRFAGIMVRDGKRILVHDGGEDPPVDGIWGATVRYSADGTRLGYCALKAGVVWLIVGGRVVEAAGAVRENETYEVLSSPDLAHMAAIVKATKGDVFVLDGKPSRVYRKLEALQTVSTGNGFAFYAEDWIREEIPGVPGGSASTEAYRWVVGGVEQPQARYVEKMITFSDDGRRFAYKFQESKKPARVILDGETLVEIGEKSGIVEVWGDSFVFSPDGRRFAAKAMRWTDRTYGIHVDGKLGALALTEARGLHFSPDSKHWACRGQAERQAGDWQRWHLVVDDTVRAEAVRLWPFAFSPDSAFVAYVARTPEGRWRLEVVSAAGGAAPVVSEELDAVFSDDVGFPTPRTVRVIGRRGQDIVRLDLAW